jgi:L,D-transpeptidase catalytic domain
MNTNKREILWVFIRENIPGLAKFLQQSAERIITLLDRLTSFIKRRYLVILVVGILFIIPFVIRVFLWILPLSGSSDIQVSEENLLLAQKKIKYELAILDRQLNAKTPKSYYLIINSASNEFSLCIGDKIIKKDKCSTGSYILLKNGEEEQWLFKTPKGEFRVQGKTTSPVWKKPDWAFIEEGLPVPAKNSYTRFEYGVLGDYALNLGDGYLIHGTLYQRFLGLPVTHGCIRLNDENLELVYRSLRSGSKVYIY